MHDRHHQEKIVQVTGRDPRIVGHVDVPGAHVLRREAGAERFHGHCHRVYVPWRAGHGLGKHPAFSIENSGRYVAAFAHDRAEGGAHESLTLFLDHGDQPVPKNLKACVVHRHGNSPSCRVIQMFPAPSTLASKSALTRVVVCGSVISAGPVRRAPLDRSARS